MNFSFFKRPKDNNLYTIAFYNLENLFDTEDDPNTLDDEFTPKGAKHWDRKRYNKKIYKLGTAISNVGYHEAKKAPSLVGLAEVENKYVLQNLINSKHLKNKGFGFVHYDSPDERGIDTALIYQKGHFEVIASGVEPLIIYNKEGERDYTRDILHVSGILNGQLVHVLVNHWPSRRDDAELTSYKRVEAARRMHGIMDKVRSEETDPSFIIMGDFNDDPLSESIKNNLVSGGLFNPMEKLYENGKGSARYDLKWNLFDQIIFSKSFFKVEGNVHTFAHADIFDEKFLAEWSGKYEGNPFRTYTGRKYLGGYSDHFPVYIQLQKH